MVCGIEVFGDVGILDVACLTGEFEGVEKENP